jgi:hypothetical protein
MNKVKIIIVVILAFLLGYIIKPLAPNINNKKIQNSPTVSPTKIVTPTDFPSPEEEVKSLIVKFEDLQKARNSDVLKLFTPSASKEEADSYSFLMALDLPVHDAPRLFATAGFAYKVTGYSVNSILKTDQGFRVEVEETRASYDNMTTGGWVNTGKKIYVFELVRNGNLWVDKYYPKNGTSGKYDGFYH